jgi:hypothetical protein
MRRLFFVARLALASLLSVLGVVIVSRGLIEAAPFTFTVMGVLMVMLGITRLRSLQAEHADRR